MKMYQHLFRSDLRYYFLIALAGILAFLPVSSMQLALKNDIVALDYPIKYFISQCLQNNIQPFWFNTWSKGFPLESIITWSFFSPLQFITGFLFEYDLYTLHAEFMFYILLGGFGMFSFLKEHFSKNKDLCFLMALAYMLSGFTVGSSQWTTYITALALLPITLHAYLGFLQKPTIATSVLLVAIYYVTLTSVYPAFTIIATYAMCLYFLFFLFHKKRTDKTYFTRTKFWRYLFLTFLLMVITYSTSLYFSIKVLNEIDRGKPILADSIFFHSNYLHPKALISLLFPFSITKIQIANTEGTMMDSYMGLFPVLLLPLSLIKNIKEKNVFSLLLLFIAIIFLTASFGHITPFREALNLLPGFSYFRNPGLFRLFFILFFLMYVTYTFRSYNLPTLFKNESVLRIFLTTIILLGIAFLLVAIIKHDSLIQLLKNVTSLKETFYSLTFNHALAISAVVQLLLLAGIFIAVKKSNYGLLQAIITCDLVLNCLLCTPFFTVSSYSLRETNERIFHSIPGFPVQKKNTAGVHTSYQEGNAIWHNINVYQKQVSEQESYVGPLKLKSSLPISTQDSAVFYNNQVLFSSQNQTKLQLLIQQPNFVSAVITTDKPTDVVLQQNYYPAWRAYFNGTEVNIKPILGAMKVVVPKSGKLEFKYERTTLYIVLIILNSMIITLLLFFLGRRLRKNYFSNDRHLEAA